MSQNPPLDSRSRTHDLDLFNHIPSPCLRDWYRNGQEWARGFYQLPVAIIMPCNKLLQNSVAYNDKHLFLAHISAGGSGLTNKG